MGVIVGRDGDGFVSIAITSDSAPATARLSPVEARLIAIKLLLAAEETSSAQTPHR
jgi:hypothetical protein